MRPLYPVAVLLAGLACGASGPESSPAGTKAASPKPPDESRRFPRENQTAMELVNDHLLGKDYLPGGNLATYDKGGKTYQLFLAATPDAQTASLAMFDVKQGLADPKFVPSFGGYYGMDGQRPMFIFAKDKYVAGVAGLTQEEADLVARDFAARIPAASP
jgi:hypothetical protein